MRKHDAKHRRLCDVLTILSVMLFVLVSASILYSAISNELRVLAQSYKCTYCIEGDSYE